MDKYVRSVVKKETLILVAQAVKNKPLPVYNDHTKLKFGKYKSKRICDIPADYLLNIYQNPTSCENKSLLVYIRKNIERIKARKEGRVLILYTCKKKTFESQALAIAKLDKLKNSKQTFKKPIREYQCPRCGGWHITSEIKKPY